MRDEFGDIHRELEREQMKKPKLKLVKPLNSKTSQATVKETMLNHHIVGIHDTRVNLGSWKPDGYAIFKQAPGEYYFVSWHSGRDPGITSDKQVRKWMKDNILHHG